jgi:hypothetical protein
MVVLGCDNMQFRYRCVKGLVFTSLGKIEASGFSKVLMFLGNNYVKCFGSV